VALSMESRALLSEHSPHGRDAQGGWNGDTAPAIRAVDDLHGIALRDGASDIHIEPINGSGRVRQRIDGILHETRRLAPELFAQVVSRIKLLAAMDIADRRQPQDGRYQIEMHGRQVDARVSSVPTIDGERLAIRLLDMQARVPMLEHLGMSAALLENYRRFIHAPYGFVVVCGPTGSGKTTTLYASLAERNVEGQHLCTIEDPVEVRLGGVAQVQVNARAGLTFPTALRSFLRQDPNVIMVGEMRDAETAGVAMSAALCGQLVLTSLHASDAPRTIERLTELGLPRHAIAAGLSAVLAQRLVRRLCTACRLPRKVGRFAEMFGLEASAVIYESGGCERCNGTGYRGRVAIFELMGIGEEMCVAIADGASPTRLADIARTDGYRRMWFAAAAEVTQGKTSIQELRRVLAVGAGA
jgi:type IV pilus assembly protein PilB